MLPARRYSRLAVAATLLGLCASAWAAQAWTSEEVLSRSYAMKLADAPGNNRLHVIYLGLQDNVWEWEFQQELFHLAHFQPKVVWDPPKDQVRCIVPTIFVAANPTDEINKLGEEFRNGSCPYGVLHSSDEFVQADTAIYRVPNVRFVLRNYYNPQVGHLPHVTTFGLGWKKLFWQGYGGKQPLDIPIAERHLVWSFAGSFGNHAQERQTAVKLFERLVPNKLVPTSFFNSPDALNTSTYRGMLLDSIFVICPLGHANIDTFRHYEAMEAGAIPVTLRGNQHLASKYPKDWPAGEAYWPYVFGDQEAIPFVAEHTWEEALREVERLLADRDALEARRRHVHHFWQRHKQRVARRIMYGVWMLRKENVCVRAPRQYDIQQQSYRLYSSGSSSGGGGGGGGGGEQ